ncbi:hypothetical protein QFC19_006355 [Naganishia cerealis]|uniref:Uncharacterized protein n=1 Tax=Naganishia cerealis TaxID=610337 RepID=A0ACC2VH80_9TREE|nr:hypothetical protein QFC19_006355 [Naganishia cerealis]
MEKVKSFKLSVQPSALCAARRRALSEFRHDPPDTTVKLSPGALTAGSTLGDSIRSLLLATPSTCCFPLPLKSTEDDRSWKTPGLHTGRQYEKDPFEHSFSGFLGSPSIPWTEDDTNQVSQRAPKTSLIPLPEVNSVAAPSDDPICDCRNKRKQLKRTRSIVLAQFEDTEEPSPTESTIANVEASEVTAIPVDTSGLQITIEDDALSTSDDEMVITGHLRRVKKHVNLRSLWADFTDTTSVKRGR